MNKSVLLFILCIILFVSYNTRAQAWKWGRRGGDVNTVGVYGIKDGIADLATDKWGNVYVIGKVFGTEADIAGHIRTCNGNNDVAIVSFTCDGTYRWSKILGAGSIDQAVAIRTDTLGGVYVVGSITGTISYGHVHIDSDTTLAYTTRSMYLLKYDTGGQYKWLVLPQPDTVSALTTTSSGAWDMDVDGSGHIAILANLTAGAYAGGAYIVAGQSLHILNYTAGGSFTSGVQLDVTYSSIEALVSIRMAKDHTRNRYYVVGGYNIYDGTTYHLGSTLINRELYAGSFSSTGACIWAKQNNDSVSYGGFENRPVIDDDGNVYMVGNTGNNLTFNGYTFTNSLGLSGYAFPFLIKLDTAGNNVWVANGASNAVSFGGGVALSGNTVAISGSYPGTLKFGTHKLISPAGTGYRSFLARFNTADGNVLGLDSLIGTAYSQVLSADRKGNFYIGGQFVSTLYAAHDTLYNAGGEYDFYVAKYGYDNCGCTVTPVASFANDTGSFSIAFTYTGPSVSVDSIVWDFGDGSHDTGSAPTHIYTTPGTYTACVALYTPCGSDTYCSSITISDTASGTTGIDGTATAGSVLVYPNPAADEVSITHAAVGSTIKLLDIAGQVVYEAIMKSDRLVIDIHALSSGIYLLQVTDVHGNRTTTKILKR